MGHWFSERERGLTFSIWNTSHNVGGGVAGVLAAWATRTYGGWEYAFYVPGAVAAAGAFYVLLRARDTPQSVGLPPIEQYREDYSEVIESAVDIERELTFRELFVDNGTAQPPGLVVGDREFLCVYHSLYHAGLGTDVLTGSEECFARAGGRLARWPLNSAASYHDSFRLDIRSYRWPSRHDCGTLHAPDHCRICWHPVDAVRLSVARLSPPHANRVFYLPSDQSNYGCRTRYSLQKAIGTAAGFIGLFGYVARMVQVKGFGRVVDYYTVTQGKEYAWNIVLYTVLVCAAITGVLLSIMWKTRPRA